MPESPRGSKHVDQVIHCNSTEDNVPDDAAITIGTLPLDLSFVYHADTNVVDFYESHKVTLSNDWRSVLVMNLSLFCLAHWLADTKKDEYKNWTVIPEIGGLLLAASGIYLQKVTNSVYHRCLDIPNGPLAAELVTWVVLLELAANVSCLVILRSQEENTYVPHELRGKVNNIRKLSYECALYDITVLRAAYYYSIILTESHLSRLGSIFLQVVSSSDSMFDAYMGFFVGAAFLYSVRQPCYSKYHHNLNTFLGNIPVPTNIYR